MPSAVSCHDPAINCAADDVPFAILRLIYVVHQTIFDKDRLCFLSMVCCKRLKKNVSGYDPQASICATRALGSARIAWARRPRERGGLLSIGEIVACARSVVYPQDMKNFVWQNLGRFVISPGAGANFQALCVDGSRSARQLCSASATGVILAGWAGVRAMNVDANDSRERLA